jgi:hypothetical protein
MTARNTTKAVNEIEAFFARAELAAAKAWMFSTDGPAFVGTLESMEMREHEKHGSYPALTFNIDGQSRVLHAFHQVLIDALTELADAGSLNIGDKLGVAWLGEHVTNASRESDDPTTYHMYYVENLTKPVAKKAVAEGFKLARTPKA